VRQISVAMADDHAMFREGLCTLLSRHPDIRVAGEASNGDELLELLDRVDADVVLLDIRMPGRNGVEICREISRVHAGMRVVMLSMYDDDQLVLDALRAGACGYVLKGASSDDLVDALRNAADGKAVVSPLLVGSLVDEIQRGEERKHSASFVRLTNRETLMLSMISEGATNREIAAGLGLSEQTVKNGLSVAFQKLGVHNRVEALNAVRALGISFADRIADESDRNGSEQRGG
jgi:DNA-binding NarL/FixJ family response regulator